MLRLNLKILFDVYTNDLLYNINTNIINTENKIDKLINIKTNVDFAYDF